MDIVERLRTYSNNSTFGIKPHLLEAAAEIERLRRELAAYQTPLTDEDCIQCGAGPEDGCRRDHREPYCYMEQRR